MEPPKPSKPQRDPSARDSSELPAGTSTPLNDADLPSLEGATSSLCFESRDPEATLSLAEHIGAKVQAGDVLGLTGDLGAGKTTFVRGLAEGMGITDPVSSPTYTLMHAYEGKGLDLFHYDAWMEGRQKAILSEGGAGVFEGDGVVVVEWAARVQEFLPSGTLTIALAHISESSRGLTLGGDISRWGALLGGLKPISGLVQIPFDSNRGIV